MDKRKLDRSHLPSRKPDPVLHYDGLTAALGMKGYGGGLKIRTKDGGSVTLSLKEAEAVAGFVNFLKDVYGWNN